MQLKNQKDSASCVTISGHMPPRHSHCGIEFPQAAATENVSINVVINGLTASISKSHQIPKV